MGDHIQLRKIEGDVYVLVFDRPGSSANLLDRATLAELDAHLDTLSVSGARGLIVRSAKEGIFIAGADVRELAHLESDEELRGIVEEGQRVLQRIAALPMTTVAAIHGACMGGGCELALALDWRIASESSRTKIGLPEVQLGILPAWGGSTRLARLIGPPGALDMILRARALGPRQARKRGLVDEIVPRELLVKAAVERIAAGKPRRKRHALTRNALAARIIGRRARANVLEKTRGNYPAPPRAVEVITRGASRSIDDSLALEREAVIDLARTSACRNLMNLFLLRERAKHLDPREIFPSLVGSSEADEQDDGVHATAVIGSGVMGVGIAQWFSARGHRVILRDVDDNALARGLASVARLFRQGVRRHVFDKRAARDGLDRIHPVSLDVPLLRIDLVVEAAVEDLSVKRDIFRRLEELAGPRTVLATNTSSLSVSRIAEGLERPDRVVGLHFFNPLHKMELVEIVAAERTDPAVAARMVRFVQKIGKLPVVVRDSPGFLVNRILLPYLVEASRLFGEGARIEDIDGVMLDFGMPMGPLRLLDEIGLDVALHVAEHLESKFGDRIPVPEVLGQMVKADHLGKKTGAGFYVHGDKGKETPVNEAARLLAHSKDAAGLTRVQMEERMVLSIENEAARCLEEEIVSAPEDVDLAMVIGTGFAPFRGGPLRHADKAGIGKVVGALERWADQGMPRFTPSELLRSMAASRRKFYE